MPRVSVITGFYNRGHALRPTVESVLRQSYRDLELILFDDKSTDDTTERLEALAAELRDPRFRAIVHSENMGFVRGMMNAIEASSGEYIAIQGSGDVSLPDRIARQVELLDARPDLVAVGCWYWNVDDESGARDVVKPNAERAKGGYTTFSHGEMMMRRSAYEQAGGYRPEFKVGQLTDLGFRLHHIGGFATVPEMLYERHIQADGVSLNARRALEQAQFLTLARHLQKVSPDEAETALSAVRTDGVGAVIPPQEQGVQLIVTERALRLCALDRGEDAALLSDHLTSRWRAGAIRMLARGVQSPVSRPLRAVLRLGLRSTSLMQALWMRLTR
jgi:GT2 family glycosyltransferase